MEGGGLVIIVGAVLIVVGIAITVSEHRAKSRRSGHPGVETKPTGAAETIDALERLLKTLQGFPTGIILIVLGLVCFIIGGAIADSSDLFQVAKSAVS